MDAIKIAFCEDLDSDAARLASLIEKSGIKAEVTRFPSGGAFLASHPAGRYDLVFFDVYMGDITGVETAKVLRESDESCGVVFTTTSEDFRGEAFDLGAEQYLIKPVNEEKLFKILQKRARSLKKPHCTINVKGKPEDVDFDDIIYVEVKNHNCIVHTVNGNIETGSSMTMDEMQRLLPESRFMRCHKSYIANLSYVESVDRDFHMKNGDTVYIRKSDLAMCRQWQRELDKWRLDEAGRDED